MQDQTNLSMDVEQMTDGSEWDFVDEDDFAQDGGENQPAQSAGDGENQPAARQNAELPDTNEPAQQAENAQQNRPDGQQSTPAVMRVRWNGQDMELTPEQAQSYAQKGMNYDHVKGELDALKANPAIGLVDMLARERGVTPEQYAQAIYAQRQQAQAGKLREAGMDEGEIRQIQEAQAQLRQAQEQLEQLRPLKEQAEQAQQRRAQYEAFARAYPGVDAAKIPQEVYQAVAQGETLLHAYTQWENQQLKTQLAAAQSQAAAQAKAPGSAAGEAPPKPETDDGWEAFMQG